MSFIYLLLNSHSLWKEKMIDVENWSLSKISIQSKLFNTKTQATTKSRARNS